MPSIRLLDDRLVGKIAAGEVVERPAAVVKELVENALDAGAGRVEIDLELGGRRRIRIADDGRGMDADDALLAFDRHATSKISTFEDLERVATLGFRGEALSSIAAVSKVELTTAPAPGEGTRVRIEGGRVLSAQPVARGRGTTIDVRSLFWNVPARRKFLKTGATELRRCLEVVEGYALARVDVGFTVRHEGRLLVDAPALEAGSAGLRARIGQLWGSELERTLVELPSQVADALVPGAWGFVGAPETARRGNRRFLFVNRRLVRDRALLATFYRAVRDEWRSDDFPALFLFLDLPPEQVDVNVHPQKSEVRFRDGGLVDRVGQLLRAGLGRARGEEAAPLRAGGPLPAVGAAWEGLGGRGPEPGVVAEGGGDAGPSWRPSPAAGPELTRLAVATFQPLERAPVPLSGRDGTARPFRLIGQYKATLILLEGPDALYLLDQHVAHERILYERFRREIEAERPAVQRWVAPELLELSRAESLRLAEWIEPLREAGFELEPLSGDALAVAAAPPSLSRTGALALLSTLATDEAASAGNLRRRLLDDFAASQACRAAIKMHHPLHPEKVEALVSELFRAENPYACPHGRPVFLKLDDVELERRFGRR